MQVASMHFKSKSSMQLENAHFQKNMRRFGHGFAEKRAAAVAEPCLGTWAAAGAAAPTRTTDGVALCASAGAIAAGAAIRRAAQTGRTSHLPPAALTIA